MKINSAADEIKKLSPNEVKAILDSDKKGEYVLIDVRQPEEYESGHLPGSVLIPLNEFEARRDDLYRERYRGEKVILICQSGRRSTAAAISLYELGFRDVFVLDGGLNDWREKLITGKPKKRPDLLDKAAIAKNVLVVAIKMEQGAHNFYQTASEKAGSPQARQMFQNLSDAEFGHMKRIYQRAIDAAPEQAWTGMAEFIAGFDKGLMEGTIEINQALTKVDENFTSEFEAIDIAIENEYLAYDFYKRSAALVVNLESKALLHELAHDERGHAITLLDRLSKIVRG
jgi:sulfur-carrier protein adenylyltransferase/sulfurtransferase